LIPDAKKISSFIVTKHFFFVPQDIKKKFLPEKKSCAKIFFSEVKYCFVTESRKKYSCHQKLSVGDTVKSEYFETTEYKK